jgi:protein PhnA
MSFEKELIARSGNKCEISGETTNLTTYLVSPKQGNSPNDFIYINVDYKAQIEGSQDLDANKWRCLNDAMWSEVDAVKVVTYRMLNQLKSEGWPNDLLDMMYLDDETLEWAKSGIVDENTPKHVDSNGVELQHGDSVVLIKDLNVKGATFTAKRGTPVRNIRLVHDNHEQIEGKINGQSIIILTQYVKK